MSFIDNYGKWSDDCWDDDDWDGIEDDSNLLEDDPELTDTHYCYLGHPDCWDEHYADRRADEANYEEEMRREGF